MLRATIACWAAWLLLASASSAQPVAADPEAVAEVLSGQRAEANAAWWGFDPDDATDALQAAINSGARRLRVPNMHSDWIVRPLRLAGDQELILEKGVVITAKRGEYRARNDCVLTARNLANLTIRGYGATVRMHKEDYIVGTVLGNLGWNRWYGPYEKAEWRTALALRGCTNVRVLGLTLRDSGGDGIYIDGGRQHFSRDIHIQDVLCDNNYRQGISVISVDGLTVENCRFHKTWGTPPSAGVDIEPDSPEQLVKRVVFRGCRFENNYGDGIEVFLGRQSQATEDVSILFDSCHVSSRRGAGIRVSKIADRPKGLVEFRDCTVENTAAYGIKVQDKSTLGARVRFVRCGLKNVAAERAYHDLWAPLVLHPSRAGTAGADEAKFSYARFGGIDFVDCTIDDLRRRAAVASDPELHVKELFDITGTITVRNPHGAQTDLGDNQHSVSFVVRPDEQAAPAPDE
jgi:polygalacturonase